MAPLFVIIPLAAALIISLLHRIPRQLTGGVALAAGLATAVLSFSLLPSVIAEQVLVYRVGGWAFPLGVLLVVDGLTAFMLVLVNTLLFLLILYSTRSLERHGDPWRFHAFFMLMAAGLNGVLLAADLFNLFVFMEIGTIAAYILTSFDRGGKNFEAAFKYSVLGTLSSLVILLAIAFVYARISSLNFIDISTGWGGSTMLSLFVLLLLTLGLALKSALVPLHAWVPDAAMSAPAPAAAAFTAVVSKVLGMYVIIRLFYNVFGAPPALLSLLSSLGVVSILVGVTLALAQGDFKRLLAYHSISQIGYIALGIGLGTPLGILGGLFHLVNHSVFKSLLFLNAGSVEYATGTADMKELGGLAKKMPVTATTSLIASMSIAGIPPLNGFWSTFIIIVACVQAGKYWWAAFAALGSMLTLASFLKVQRYLFSGYLNEAWSSVKEPPAAMAVPMVGLAIACLSMGLLLVPGINEGFLTLAADAVARGRDFALAVTGALR